MKTIRTILATFGVTTLLYGAFALLMIGMNPPFTGRSIYQLFRETGFVTLVIGVGCVLSAVIMTVALVSFRDESPRKKHAITDDEDDLDEFLEEETVPEERAAEADETWSNEIKRKQRRALRHTDEDDEEDEPYEYYAEEEDLRPHEIRREAPVQPEPEPYVPAEPETHDEPAPGPSKYCPYCGNAIDADSTFCIYCGKRV